ncbi:MAG: PqqD family protein [Nitrospiraceae bacterium]
MNVQPMLATLAPKCNPDIHGTAMDGEMVLLNLGSGRYYTLNAVGATVWEGSREGRTLGDIHHAICARFDVSPDRAEGDLLALINQLEGEGLLSVERG